MRVADYEVREVVCSETGKPMPKIPLWMADVKVKFVSDEARQKHPVSHGVADLEPRRSLASTSDLDELREVAGDLEEPDPDFEELDAEEIGGDLEAEE